MFTRRSRLSRDGFTTASLRGKRLSSTHFSILLPEKVRGYAVVVSKKTERLSVGRHRIKRRVTEALKSLSLPPAIVVYPRAAVKTLPFPVLREELSVLLSKIRNSP